MTKVYISANCCDRILYKVFRKYRNGEITSCSSNLWIFKILVWKNEFCIFEFILVDKKLENICFLDFFLIREEGEIS